MVTDFIVLSSIIIAKDFECDLPEYCKVAPDKTYIEHGQNGVCREDLHITPDQKLFNDASCPECFVC